MTHLPYIIAVYALGVLVPAAYAIDALLRSRRAVRLLAAAEAGGRRASREVVAP
jgi:hypothetical protein